MNLKTAARRLGVHYQTAYRWVRSGQLVAVKVGSGYEISEAALARFQAQRTALERHPDLDAFDARPSVSPVTPDQALDVLDAMLHRVTIDAHEVAARATRLVSELLGDAVIFYGVTEDGFDVRHVAHPDPACEVTVATVARHGDPNAWFARVAVNTDEPLLLPQVPQRQVRDHLRAEVQHQLLLSGCYSALSVPVHVHGEAIGALVASRDTPTRPFTRDDLDLVRALAARVERAYTVAADSRAAWEMRQAVVDALTAHDGDAMSVVERTVADDDAVAVLDLDLRHSWVTTSYAALFAAQPACLHRTPLAPMASAADVLRDALARVRFGEIDYCHLQIEPVATPGTRVMLHAAMVREPDATPRCLVIVAHGVPAAPSLEPATD